MRKYAQRVEWKTQSKISCHYTWLLHAKNCLSRWLFLRSYLSASKPSRRSISAAKRREKEIKRKGKKIPKIKKPKDLGHFIVQKLSQNSDFCTCPSHSALKRDAFGEKRKLLCCKLVSTRLKVIRPRSSLKITKLSKKPTFCKKFQESMG